MPRVTWGGCGVLKSRSDLSLRLKSGPDLSPSCSIAVVLETWENVKEQGCTACWGMWNMFSLTTKGVCAFVVEEKVLWSLKKCETKKWEKCCRMLEKDAGEKSGTRGCLVLVLKRVCCVEMGVCWCFLSRISKNEKVGFWRKCVKNKCMR